MRVTHPQNVPLSCLSRLFADRLAEAAYKDILGLSYARAFPQLGVLPAVIMPMVSCQCTSVVSNCADTSMTLGTLYMSNLQASPFDNRIR